MSAVTAKGTATLDDLNRVDGKAELIAGRIIHLMPTGLRPGLVSRKICNSLETHTQVSHRGMAIPDNIGFAVPELPSGRESFAPDAAYYDGLLPDDDMDFIPGAPSFAVEVRSKGDYGPAAEREMAAKRLDYFDAGTSVVWDVDTKAECVHSYRADAPDRPIIFRKGEVADAEPAVPGWRIAVDEVFA